MSMIEERADAGRLLDGIESGMLSDTDAAMLVDRIDPVLFWVIVRFLRDCYPASDPAANAVLGRVVQLASGEASHVAKFKEGEQDPVSGWFVDDYSFRDFRGRGHELLDLIVDKLDS